MAERKMPSAEDYPSNANGVKEMPPKEAPMKMRGKVSQRHNVFNDVKNEFISEDAPRVGSYILYDVLVPALRDLISDILHGSVDTIFGAGGRGYGGYRSGGGRSNVSYTPYNRYYYDDDRGSRRSYREERRSSRRDRDPSAFTFSYKEDAEDLLDFLCDYIDRYGEVPVALFYDKIGETIPGDFTSEDYGWRNLASAKVMPAGRGEWYINFPRVRAL